MKRARRALSPLRLARLMLCLQLVLAHLAGWRFCKRIRNATLTRCADYLFMLITMRAAPLRKACDQLACYFNLGDEPAS